MTASNNCFILVPSWGFFCCGKSPWLKETWVQGFIWRNADYWFTHWGLLFLIPSMSPAKKWHSTLWVGSFHINHQSKTSSQNCPEVKLLVLFPTDFSLFSWHKIATTGAHKYWQGCHFTETDVQNMQDDNQGQWYFNLCYRPNGTGLLTRMHR